MTPPKNELSEKDFIHEGYRKNPFPFWLWLCILTAIVAVAWGGSQWYSGKVNSLFRESPFLQVTNRQLSLFLWQNPEFMRVNAKQKNGYLTGFQYTDNVTMELASADHYAVAPPNLLFRYHTWDRLVKEEFISRPIAHDEFKKFLDDVPEWLPTYWPNAPKEYSKFVEGLSSDGLVDLNDLPLKTIPLNVRIAFQGWKNYFKEGEAINQVRPSVAEMRQFLSKSPHYARNYWRNIVEDSNPNYLRSINAAKGESEAYILSDEMAPFLKVAIYNFLQLSKKEKKEEV